MAHKRDTSDAFSQLVERIYAAAIDPDSWTEVIGRATEHVGAQSAVVFLWNDGGPDGATVFHHRSDPEMIARWSSELAREDWSNGAAARFPEGHFVTTGASVIAPAAFRITRTFNDLLKERIVDMLCCSLHRNDPMLSVLCFHSDQLFQRAQVERLERLAPHLRLAGALQWQLHELRSRRGLAEAALDALTLGVFVLDERGRVTRANRKAEAILEQADGLGVRECRLRCTASAEGRELEGAISRAVDGSERRTAATGRALRIPRPSRRRPFGVIVSPIVPPAMSRTPLFGVDGMTGAAVLVTVSDPEDAEVPASEPLRQLFGLTPAESRLAAALAGGLSVGEYAEQSEVAIGTARWTLKRVLEKTGCRRQGELVRLLVGSVASMVRSEHR